MLVTITITNGILFSICLAISIMLNIALGLFLIFYRWDLHQEEYARKYYEEKYVEYMKKYINTHSELQKKR